jgi:hypothetical protein
VSKLSISNIHAAVEAFIFFPVIHLKAAGWMAASESNVGFRVETKAP